MKKTRCMVCVQLVAAAASGCTAGSVVGPNAGATDGGGGRGGSGVATGGSGASSGAMAGSSGSGSSSATGATTGSGSGAGVSSGQPGPGSGQSAGTGAGTGALADAGSDAPPPMGNPAMPKIPAPTGTCPTLATGNVTILGQMVQLAVGTKQADKKGAVFFYWHGTGGSPTEVSLLGPAVNEITSEGGIVASFSTTTGMGTNTGDAVWYTGDFAMADEILACAVQQLNIDPRRIYTGGCSAGGLQAGAMLYGRSSYLAAVMPNLGGTLLSFTLEDPSHVPAIITTHGAPSTGGGVIIDFTRASMIEDKDVVSKGGFAVDCDHGGSSCNAPAADVAGQWQFCKDHPFAVTPEPYAGGLPSSFPSYCTIIK